MNYDIYDEDLPVIERSWAESFTEVKSAVILSAKLVAIPATVCALTCIANYFINKKVESL